MFSTTNGNFTKLKTNLRLALNRLKLLEKKKTELTQKSRREIADYIQAGKYERAKIRVEHIIREDYLVEAMEIVEIYCDLLLARFGLVTQMKDLDDGIAEAVSSLIWVGPRLQADIQELKVIGDLLAMKYGKPYSDSCRSESVNTISEKLKHKLSIQSPPKLLVEKYLIEIAKNYNISYEPDPQVMQEAQDNLGHDGILIDFGNNLGGSGGGGGAPQAGFIGYPHPDFPAVPFSYPPLPPSDPTNAGFLANAKSSEIPPFNTPFAYNIPPSTMESKESNIHYGDNSLPTYSMAMTPDDNLQNLAQKPLPHKISSDSFSNLPDLPSVPSDSPVPSTTTTTDIDFDDLSRRFEALKKKK